jgi:hypothetical protein
LYLYKSGPDKVAAYLVGFEADRRTKEVRESVWKLREMNEAGHRINRAILDGVPLVKIGGTELAARLGEPQFRLGQRDGSSHWIYVFGQDNLSLMAFGNEAFKQAIKQRFGGCRIVVDSAGVVQSFEIF